MGKYAVVYTAYTREGPGVALALTEDFRSFERFGVIMPPEDKDAALLPHRIGGKWALIHRPVSAPRAHMWMSYSPDLRHWGSHTLMLDAAAGPGGMPTRSALLPSHRNPAGVADHLPRRATNGVGLDLPAGARALRSEEPGACLKRSDEWFFGPEAAYEQRGDVGNVVFPCGSTIAPDGDTIRLYYGAADSSIALATGSLRALLDWLGC